MPFAVELFFDPVGEAGVRGLWDELAGSRAPGMRASGARPHLSLAVADDVEWATACKLVDRIAAATKRFPITFSSVGFFPGEKSILFLAPVVTSGLLALHAEFCAGFPAVARNAWEHYSPAAWVPHCTLATDLPTCCLGEAAAIPGLRRMPFSCEAIEIGLVEFPPSRQLHAASLIGKRVAG